MIKPGGSQAGIINVNNPSSEDKDVRVYLEDWYYVNSDGSKEFKPAGTLANSCASWITVSPQQFHLPALSSIPIHYTVKVPPKAVGGHYAVIFFESLIGKAVSEGEVGVNLSVRIGALFYIEPEGTINKMAQVERISLTQKQADTPFQLKAYFKNTGNIDITATGVFNIIDKEGMVLARGQFNDIYTFPKEEAVLTSHWDGLIEPGVYDLIITLDLGGTPYIKEAGIKIPKGQEEIDVIPRD